MPRRKEGWSGGAFECSPFVLKSCRRRQRLTAELYFASGVGALRHGIPFGTRAQSAYIRRLRANSSVTRSRYSALRLLTNPAQVMRILHILDHSPPLQSGYVIRTLGIVNQQRALGWEPVLLTSGKHYAPGPARERIGEWEFLRTRRPNGLAARLPW